MHGKTPNIREQTRNGAFRLFSLHPSRIEQIRFLCPQLHANAHVLTHAPRFENRLGSHRYQIKIDFRVLYVLLMQRT